MEKSEPHKVPSEEELTRGAALAVSTSFMVMTIAAAVTFGAAAFDDGTPDWLLGTVVGLPLWVTGFAVAGFFPLGTERRNDNVPVRSLALVLSSIAVVIAGSTSSQIVPFAAMVVTAAFGGYISRTGFARAASMKASHRGD